MSLQSWEFRSLFLPGMARVQWLDKYEPSLEAMDALRCVDRPFVVGDVVAARDDPTGALGAVVRVELKADVRLVHAAAPPPEKPRAGAPAAPAPAPNPKKARGGRNRGSRGAESGDKQAASVAASVAAAAGAAAAGRANARGAGGPKRDGGAGGPAAPPPAPAPLGAGATVRGLDAAALAPATGLRMGDPVVHRLRGRWVGRVVGATYDVTVRSPAGNVCVVSGLGDNGAEATATLEPLDDVDYGFDELCPFFPGQRVSAPPSVWRRASWRTGRAPPGRRRRHGLVEKVDVAQAGVQWLAWGVGASREPPPTWSDAKDVDVLAPFAGLTRVGDHVRGAAPADDAAAASAPAPAPGAAAAAADAPPPPPPTDDKAPLPRGACAQVVRTETRCAVRWSVAAADGAAAAAGVGGGDAAAVVSSLDLVPRQHLGEHDFLPNDFVIKRVDEKSDDDDDEPPAEDDGAVGVVRSVDARQRTCVVRWLGDGEADALEPLAPAKTETLSAYELALHGSYNFSAGDLVLRLAPGAGRAGDVAGDGDGAAGATRDAAGAIAIVALPDDVESEQEASELAEAIRLSLLDAAPGDGDAEEPRPAAEGDDRWVGQVLSLADGAVAVLWLDGSRELVPPRRLLLVPDARADDPAYDDDDADDPEDDGTAESASTQGPVEPDDEAEAAAPAAEAAADDGGDDGGDDAAADDGDDDDDDDDAEPFAVCDGGAPADHAYASAAAQKVALPAVRKLWKQLEKNLPTGVFVRAFQDRSDLLRCVIVGPDGTPYERMVFAFDLQLPAAYPKEPPAMHYHSWGITERLNPNLYENGKVCLSLLGTWSGPGWDPESSTVLQLLVSLQGLVLVDKPYYNEPGNEKHAGTLEGEQQARSYNENAKLLALQATISAAKRPPAPFRAVLVEHFKAHADAMAKDLEHAASDGDGAPAEGAPAYSDGFRRVLRKLLPQFRRALDKLGVKLQ